MDLKGFSKDKLVQQLKRQIKIHRHIIGVAAGSGLTAKYAEEGGADFILALSSGYFRQKGLSSLAAYLPFLNSNDAVMEFGVKELLPRTELPVLFGLMATDPTKKMETLIQAIKDKGFAGINNYPTIGLIDGIYREALEEQGYSFEKEIESIQIANKLGLFTVAFVFDKEQALQMAAAGADVICLHLGLTSGGKLGSKQIQSLQSARKLAQEVFEAVAEKEPSVIKMVYGGPLKKPVDVQFIYDGANIDGYIGGSVFERIPAEQVVLRVTESFKKTNDVQYDELIEKITSGFTSSEDYIEFVKRYVSLHYQEELSLNEISAILHISRSHLSTLFKRNVGIAFTDYLIDFRLNRAVEIYQEKQLPLSAIAELVGYPNYSQFSKIFKKRMGKSPRAYFESNITTS